MNNNGRSKNPEIKKLLKLIQDSQISSIKEVVSQIISIINNPDSSATDLRKIIEKDPPLTAKLLKLSNSAFYGYPKAISEIHEAIICIGFDTVKELALNQKVCELFKQNEYIHGYSRISLWYNSVAAAIFSKLIYRREFRRRGDNIYAAALLQDIGIIVLDQFLHDQFVKILKIAENQKRNLTDVENEILGFNHADIGEAISQAWGFTDEMVWAIANHNNPDIFDEYYKQIGSSIFIANYIVQENMIGYSDSPFHHDKCYKTCLKELGLKEKALRLILEEVKTEIDRMKNSNWF